MEYDFQKSCVTGPWDHKDSVSAKKVKKKKFHACVPLRINCSVCKEEKKNFLVSDFNQFFGQPSKVGYL